MGRVSKILSGLFVSFSLSQLSMFGADIADRQMIINNQQKYVKERNVFDSSRLESSIKILESLSEIIYISSNNVCKHVMSMDSRKLTLNDRQRIKKLIKNITIFNMSHTESKIHNPEYGRIAEYDSKVYYSSLALRSILECVLDENYMGIIGGFAKEFIDDFDCIAYGREVERADKVFNA